MPQEYLWFGTSFDYVEAVMQEHDCVGNLRLILQQLEQEFDVKI